MMCNFSWIFYNRCIILSMCAWLSRVLDKFCKITCLTVSNYGTNESVQKATVEAMISVSQDNLLTDSVHLQMRSPLGVVWSTAVHTMMAQMKNEITKTYSAIVTFHNK